MIDDPCKTVNQINSESKIALSIKIDTSKYSFTKDPDQKIRAPFFSNIVHSQKGKSAAKDHGR